MELNQLPPLFVGMVIRQINLLKLIGIDVFDESNSLKKYGRITIFGSFLMCMLSGQILYVIKGNTIGANFLDIVNAIPSVFIVVQVSVKMWVFILKKNQIREIIIEIGKEWPECSDEEKSKELLEWTQKLKFFDNGLLSYLFFVFLLRRCLLRFTNFIPEPMQSTIFHLCVYVSCDFVLVDLIFALSSLLSLVQIDLRNMNLPSIKRSSEDDCNDIKKLVKTHQNLLRCIEKLNNIFGTVIFTQVSFSSIVICCYGFMAITADGMLLRNVTASFGIMFAIFILAWPGQLLIDTSSGVAEAAYQCHWYERNIKFRKYISIIIARSKKPCQLSALDFSDLSLAMFSKVLSTSWSYLSLLNQIYEDFDL